MRSFHGRSMSFYVEQRYRSFSEIKFRYVWPVLFIFGTWQVFREIEIPKVELNVFRGNTAKGTEEKELF